VTIWGNGIVKTISVNQRIGLHPKLLENLIYYNFVERLTNKEENKCLSIEEDLSANGIII
jgi:hypothetical protein